jgi:cell division protein FtsB
MHEAPHPPVSPPPPVSHRMRLRLTAQDTRERRRRLVTWGLSLTLAALLVNALVGENGYLASKRAEREEATLKAEVARLRLENQRLQAQRERLETDPAAVEDVARRTLGMVRPGETMVVIHDAAPTPVPPPVK